MTSTALNCGDLAQTRQNYFLHMHICVSTYLSWMLTVLLVVQAYFKRISLLSVQTLEKSTQNENNVQKYVV